MISQWQTWRSLITHSIVISTGNYSLLLYSCLAAAGKAKNGTLDIFFLQFVLIIRILIVKAFLGEGACESFAKPTSQVSFLFEKFGSGAYFRRGLVPQSPSSVLLLVAIPDPLPQWWFEWLLSLANSTSILPAAHLSAAFLFTWLQQSGSHLGSEETMRSCLMPCITMALASS